MIVRDYSPKATTMIRIRQVNKDGPYVCLNCCDVEDVPIPNRQLVWKHLNEFHEWTRLGPKTLSIKET